MKKITNNKLRSDGKQYNTLQQHCILTNCDHDIILR